MSDEAYEGTEVVKVTGSELACWPETADWEGGLVGVPDLDNDCLTQEVLAWPLPGEESEGGGLKTSSGLRSARTVQS